jgi:hypothetical protein
MAKLEDNAGVIVTFEVSTREAPAILRGLVFTSQNDGFDPSTDIVARDLAQKISSLIRNAK